MTLCRCGAERPPNAKFCTACGLKHIQAEAMVQESRLTRRERIDQQWYIAMPKGWGTWGNDKGMHSGERGMLYDILDEDEGIEALVGGTYRAEQDTSRTSKHKGVAVATDKRVIFLDKGVFGSTEVSEMPFRSIEGITHSTGMMFGGVQITGIGRAGWRIEDVRPKESAKLFADSVRGLVEAHHTKAARTADQKADSPMSAPEELEKWAKLRNDGILTQEEFDAKKRQLLGL